MPNSLTGVGFAKFNLIYFADCSSATNTGLLCSERFFYYSLGLFAGKIRVYRSFKFVFMITDVAVELNF